MSKSLGGEKNLEQLMQGVNPTLNKGVYVYTTLKDDLILDRNNTLFEFKEKESTTVVLEKKQAEVLKLPYQFESSWITLSIHSSLEAVGFIALISSTLAKENISANVVSGYYHDHIFVPLSKTDRAMEVLKGLTTTKEQ